MNDTASTPIMIPSLAPRRRAVAGISSEILLGAAWESLRKLNPRTLARNPVMFVVEIVSVLTTILVIRDIVTGAGGVLFSAQITFWLWFTVIFANFAEAVAEGRGKAQADNLRRMRTETQAKRLAAMSVSERADLPGVSRTRAPQLAAAALVADAAMDLFGLNELEICPWALREGIILHYLQTTFNEPFDLPLRPLNGSTYGEGVAAGRHVMLVPAPSSRP